MISCKAITKILWGNFEKSFLECEKKASRNMYMFRHFFRAHFFMFVLLISNHTVFLVQFEINLHLWVFQKAEIALAEAARAISAFWKTHSCKLIPNWTRNRMITYTYRGLKSTTHRGHVFFEVDRWPSAGFSIGSRAHVRLTCWKQGRIVWKPVNASPGLKFIRIIADKTQIKILPFPSWVSLIGHWSARPRSYAFGLA